MLALRDEMASRAFDPPGAWWPDFPGVVGGRDRLAGGTWCASDAERGVTVVVLNRPDRRVAAAGAPSRGMLPLLGVRHEERWPEYLDVETMASFNLVLVTPTQARWWWFDGERLRDAPIEPGVTMFTPRGLASDVDSRFLASAVLSDAEAPTEEVWRNWLPVVDDAQPSTDPNALLVRKPIGDDSYETVFAQCIAARPGMLRLDYRTHPAARRDSSWFTSIVGVSAGS